VLLSLQERAQIWRLVYCLNEENMKRVLKLSVLFMALSLSGSLLAEDIKIGVADLERAVNEVGEGAAAKAELKKEFEQKQKLLDSKQDEVKKMQEALETQATMMKPSVLQEKNAERDKKVREVQQLYMSMQQDMQKKQQEVMGAILQKMGTVLQTIGKDGDYTVILNKNEASVLFAKPHLDVTNELIRRYNDSYGKGKAKPAAKPAEKKKK